MQPDSQLLDLTLATRVSLHLPAQFGASPSRASDHREQSAPCLPEQLAADRACRKRLLITAAESQQVRSLQPPHCRRRQPLSAVLPSPLCHGRPPHCLESSAGGPTVAAESIKHTAGKGPPWIASPLFWVVNAAVCVSQSSQRRRPRRRDCAAPSTTTLPLWLWGWASCCASRRRPLAPASAASSTQSGGGSARHTAHQLCWLLPLCSLSRRALLRQQQPRMPQLSYHAPPATARRVSSPSPDSLASPCPGHCRLLAAQSIRVPGSAPARAAPSRPAAPPACLACRRPTTGPRGPRRSAPSGAAWTMPPSSCSSPARTPRWR